ncbi:MAG: NAD(P)/FAD-dependent oxidoreductase [Theionarchaea archaeon]|nr:NAD(P)/FAD-dependent oxidoreductase [Theionarchaea archaeon]MBU7037167.1 NAD(P)/FAD-dependent oxidoreductase [Theionarchaea archaeon]
MEKKYDMVVVGCGIAGAVAGLTALRDGLKVCIIEKKGVSQIGTKPCGELTTQEALDFLKNMFGLSMRHYPLKGLKICTPSGSTSYAREPLCTIDRSEMGQVLVRALLDQGADIYHESAKSPMGTSCVKGVQTSAHTFYGTVTLDCSGVAAAVRRHLPMMTPQFGAAYKERVVPDNPVELEYATLVIDKTIIRSGYMWCFPKSESELNVGAGGIHYKKAALQEGAQFVLDMLDISGKRDLPGMSAVPISGPLPSLVHPGVLVCGDAAGQVNPLTGEGIAPAITAGYSAAKTVAIAVETDDSSIETLWRYNCEAAASYGVVHASLVPARDFLLSLGDRDVNRFLRDAVSDEDMANLIKGIINMDAGKVAQIIYRCWKAPQFLHRLYQAAQHMNEIRSLYLDYPQTPEEFPLWAEKMASLRHFG